MKSKTAKTPNCDTVHIVVVEGDRVICHTAATLDAWWAGLAPHEKAEALERHLEAELDRPVSVTSCNLKRGALDRKDFVEAMVQLQTAGLSHISARKVLDARGAAIHGGSR